LRTKTHLENTSFALVDLITNNAINYLALLNLQRMNPGAIKKITSMKNTKLPRWLATQKGSLAALPFWIAGLAIGILVICFAFSK